MHIMVLGAGVIGVTTAYYLAKSGYQVTVIDRQKGPALETSFGNAGQITPGYSSPWAAPGIPLKAMKWMFQSHAPLAIHMTRDRFQYQWMLQMLGQCNAQSYQINKERMVRISQFSRDCFDQIRKEIDFHYDARQLGTLQIFRTEQQLEAVQKDIKILKAENVPHRLLNAQELLTVEPALAKAEVKILGGLHLQSDQTGDCYKFTTQLAERCKSLGVKFIFNTEIEHLLEANQKIQGIRLKDKRILTADQYVLALGSYSRGLTQHLKLNLPVYPLKGYSITTPIVNSDYAPVSTVLDESYKVALTRFDDRIRVGGMAEICGFDKRLNPQRENTLKMVLSQLFPQASQIEDTQFWTGFRPTTPDGTPIIGQTHVKNLWTNTGHGTLGWTMSCGSAQLLAELIAQRKPSIQADDLSFARYA